MTGPEAAAAAEAQRRLVLAMRAVHGPALPDRWAEVCEQARALSCGQLTLDELDRVAAVLASRGGLEAVAAGSCQVKIILARRQAGAARPPAPARVPVAAAVPTPRAACATLDGGLQLAEVQAALRVDDALAPDDWQRRLAELEAEYL